LQHRPGPSLGCEECSRAASGDDSKATKHSSVPVPPPMPPYALRRSGDVKLEVSERAELRGDDAGERVCVLGVERVQVVGQRGLVVLGACRWPFLKRCERLCEGWLDTNEEVENLFLAI